MTALGIALLVGIALAQPIVRASWPDAFQRRPPTEKSGGDALAVVMLLDISRGSWPLRDLIDLKDAVGRALATSLRDGDWVAVGSISDQLRMPEALTTMPTNLPPLLREPFDVSWGARHGNTPIWDAVDRSVGLLARAPSAARRIVLLYTSGRPAGNVLPLSEAVARARAARVAVHAAVRPTFQARLKQTWLDRRAVDSAGAPAAGADDGNGRRPGHGRRPLREWPAGRVHGPAVGCAKSRRCTLMFGWRRSGGRVVLSAPARQVLNVDPVAALRSE